MRELDRVGQQIGDDLPQPQRIAHQCAAFAEQAGLGHVEQQLDVFFMGPLAQQGEGVAGNILDSKTALIQFQLASLHLGKIQNVVDDAEQRFRRIVDLGHVIVLAGIEVGSERQIRHAKNCVHGRAYLMAHVRQKHRFGMGRVFRLFARYFKFFLNGVAASDIVFYRLRHRVDGAAQRSQFVESAQRAGACCVVARGQSVRALAQAMNRHQHVAPNHAQRQHRHNNGPAHTHQRQQDPAFQSLACGRNLGIGAPGRPCHQSVHGGRQISLQYVVGFTVDQPARKVQPCGAVGNELFGFGVVQALGRGKSFLLDLVHGRSGIQNTLERQQLWLAEAG